MSASKYDHVTSVLRKLRWLPVDQRIQFAILPTTFKAVRSCSLLLLHIPVSRLKSSGDCAFCVTDPRCGIGYQRTLGNHHLLNILNPVLRHICLWLPFLLNK